MADQDKSLFDRAKEALGMGAGRGDEHPHDDEHHEHHEHGHEHEDRIETERPAEDASPHRTEPIGGVSGAPEAAGWAGASGGMGASGAMGGAGAGGPVGATDPTLEDGDMTAGADPGAVKTEYEMGHETDPALDPLAESGPRGGSEPEEHPSVVEDEDR